MHCYHVNTKARHCQFECQAGKADSARRNNHLDLENSLQTELFLLKISIYQYQYQYIRYPVEILSCGFRYMCLFLFVCVLALSLLVCFQMFLVEMLDRTRGKKRKKKQGFGYNPWNHTNIHLPTSMVNCRATCSLDAELRMLNEDVTFCKGINLS